MVGSKSSLKANWLNVFVFFGRHRRCCCLVPLLTDSLALPSFPHGILTSLLWSVVSSFRSAIILSTLEWICSVSTHTLGLIGSVMLSGFSSEMENFYIHFTLRVAWEQAQWHRFHADRAHRGSHVGYGGWWALKIKHQRSSRMYNIIQYCFLLYARELRVQWNVFNTPP